MKARRPAALLSVYSSNNAKIKIEDTKAKCFLFGKQRMRNWSSFCWFCAKCIYFYLLMHLKEFIIVSFEEYELNAR